MTRQLKDVTKIIMWVVALFSFIAIALPASDVAASVQDQQNILGQLCDGPNRPAGANCTTGTAESGVTNIMSQIINVASWIAGVVSTIVLIIAGLMYVLSSGSPDSTARARSAMIYALVGIVVALAANVLVQYAFDEVQTPSP